MADETDAPGAPDFLVPRSHAGKRLDIVLEELVPGISRARLQKLVRKGKVRIDGQRVLRSNVRVQGGQHVRVELAGGVRAPAPDEIEVLHEDEDVVGIHKPAGIVVHPTERIRGDTVCERMAARFGRFSTAPGDHRPGIVHRLDRQTSGVMILARSDRAAHELQRQFRDREASKRYVAIVHGSPKWDRTVLESRIGPHPEHPDRQVVAPPRDSREAITEVEVLERFALTALVECRPRTGRRHQIRVQLCAAGHAVVGDEIYRPGPRVAIDPATFAMTRQALHALELVVHHPADGAPLRLHAAPPRDMQELLAALRDPA